MRVILELKCIKLSHFPILHSLIQMLLTSSLDVICNFQLFFYYKFFVFEIEFYSNLIRVYVCETRIRDLNN